MKKTIGVVLMTLLMIVVLGSDNAIAESLADDLLYQIIYDAAVRTAEEAGYTNYEIIIDDNYNATINVFPDDSAAAKSSLKGKTSQAHDNDAAAEAEAKENENVLGEQADKEENMVATTSSLQKFAGQKKLRIPKNKETTEKNEVDEEEERKNASEKEYALGIQELEKENIIDAMQHFFRALPNEEAEKMIAENAYDYVDELMFEEEYQSAQEFMLAHPFDGYEQMLAECNDYCFMLDLAKGLNARWSISEQAGLTWSDKKMRQYYQQLVECETQYLDKYMTLGFSDPQLADFAYAYIGALQSQMTGASYYGIDNEKYNENWTEHGVDVRSRLIYLMNRKYEIEIDPSFSKTFEEMVYEGLNLDYIHAVTESITTQLVDIDLHFRKNGGYITLAPFTLKNTSGYDLTNRVYVYVVLLDSKGIVIERSQLFNARQTIKDGANYIQDWAEGYSIFDPFASVYFEAEIYDSNRDKHLVTIHPVNQYAWYGQEIVVNGYNAASADSESIALEEISSYWTLRNESFVPCAEFILRNDGNAEIKEASIECVFINKDDNTEWSRDKYFALSSSDTPLRSGQGRNIIVYSSAGYEKKTRKVPDLAVEIYVNGKPTAKIDVTKP